MTRIAFVSPLFLLLACSGGDPASSDRPDSGADAALPEDGGVVPDAGHPEDGGEPGDAGESVDAGKPDDAGLPEDGGEPGDAGLPADGGDPTDAGSPCDVAWTDVQFGGALDDEITDLRIGDDGTLYLTGYEGGLTGVTNIEPTGDALGFVRALHPDGSAGWKTTFDTTGTDTVESLALVPGGFRIAGRTTGAFPNHTNQGQQDTFVAALDAVGTVTRIVQTGSVKPQHPRRISTFGEFLYVGGQDDDYVPTNTNYVESWSDTTLAAFEEHADGTVRAWDWALGSAGTDFGTSVLAVPGGVFLSGMSDSGAQRGPFVRRFSSDADFLWGARLTQVALDAAADLALTPGGDLLVAGSTLTQVGAVSYGEMDAFVMRIDPVSGTLLAKWQAGGPDTDWVTGMDVDAAGNVYLTGVTWGKIDPDATFHGDEDAFVLRFDASGQRTGWWQEGTPGLDTPSAVRVDRCGRVFVAGYTEGPLAGAHEGRRDAFVRRVTFR